MVVPSKSPFAQSILFFSIPLGSIMPQRATGTLSLLFFLGGSALFDRRKRRGTIHLSALSSICVQGTIAGGCSFIEYKTWKSALGILVSPFDKVLYCF